MPKATFIAAVLSCALLSASGAGFLRAQARPGPITPGRSNDASPSARPQLTPRARPPAPVEQPVPRQTISGTWKLNTDQSDDAREMIARTEQNSTANGTWGGGGGSGPYGGGPWGGSPFPTSGGGPYGGNRGGERGAQSDFLKPSMREYILPAVTVTFSIKDGEAALTYDGGNKRVFYTDGRKLQKPKNDTYREITAHWEGGRLVAQEKGREGQQVRLSFELSADGLQLDEYVSLSTDRDRTAVRIHYVYDIAPEKP